MRVLLLHPEDSPLTGPWAAQRWDLVADLGRSSEFSETRWSRQCGCAVLRAEEFRQGIDDVRRVREILQAGRGRLIDAEGIDWWDLMSLLFVPELLTVLALGRMATQMDPSAELWATRSGWPANVISFLTGRPVQSFDRRLISRVASRVGRYAGLAKRFSAAQIQEILLDKYDSGYRWRRRFAARPKRWSQAVVLVPSAYGNVSRAAAAYAELLPQQPFLMVATRQSAKRFTAPANVEVRDLAAYAGAEGAEAEIAGLATKWIALKRDLGSIRELQALTKAGVLDSIPGWLGDGILARDAWRGVLDHEPVSAVLCGDDSNLFTRLPVHLAARRKIPTVDFHHGAFDGRYLLKELPCDLYLAKNEMEKDYLVRVCGLTAERIGIASACHAAAREMSAGKTHDSKSKSIIFFSEPYESAGMRGEEVYREIVPELCRVARENGKDVVVKLHPFEGREQRSRVLDEILSREDRRLVSVMDGPLTSALLSLGWCGATVESTAALDCMEAGLDCFLCGWLRLSPFEYVKQFARFGVGDVLENAGDLREIPRRLAQERKRTGQNLAEPVDPVSLKEWLATGASQRSGVRSAS
jgi:hypothetical protein